MLTFVFQNSGWLFKNLAGVFACARLHSECIKPFFFNVFPGKLAIPCSAETSAAAPWRERSSLVDSVKFKF